MLNISLIDLAKILGARYQGEANIFPLGVAIDSRKVQPGDLFFALPGEKVDGHDFVEKAFENGAIGAVISDPSRLKNLRHKNLLICKDTLDTLQRMAKLIRENCNIPVIAITGSTGKTTTKDLLYSILEQSFKTIKTEGNYNNELGLPLTLCRLDKSHEALVLEMGMRGLGQIDFLCELAQPNYGVITNIGFTHAEILGSQEKIAEAKAELLKNLPVKGLAVLNYGDKKLLEPFLRNCQAQVLWFGTEAEADFRIKEILELTESKTTFILAYNNEEHLIDLNIPGEHNVFNAVAAIGISLNLGIQWSLIKKGLANIELTKMRLEIEANKEGVKIINDTYNANPQSMEAALKVLKNVQGHRKIAVLGDMYELGIYEKEGHKKIGTIAHNLDIDFLITVGKLGQLIGQGALQAGLEKSRVLIIENNTLAVKALRDIITKDDVILVKGSRGMKMEEIVQELMG